MKCILWTLAFIFILIVIVSGSAIMNRLKRSSTAIVYSCHVKEIERLMIKIIRLINGVHEIEKINAQNIKG